MVELLKAILEFFWNVSNVNEVIGTVQQTNSTTF